jgi:hypothetical protein
MSNAYAKEKTTLRYYNEIDELSYLELNKVFLLCIFRTSLPKYLESLLLTIAFK